VIQAFYKSKPEQDTPYRKLSLIHEEGWWVRLVAGEKWGKENADILNAVPVESFDAGQVVFDRMYNELCAEGSGASPKSHPHTA
jgi:hypothetical protein